MTEVKECLNCGAYHNNNSPFCDAACEYEWEQRRDHPREQTDVDK